MPELPEVETIRSQLVKRIRGKKIVEVIVKKKGIIKFLSPLEFRKSLIGEVVSDILRKAKVLIIKLREDKFLIIHLRISGWLLYGKEEEKARIIFKFSDGSCLNYMDKRLLGQLYLSQDYKELKFIRELGPEPFEITFPEFKELLKSKKTKIKVLLMDQTLISGIGNIYAQEALFLAQIDPRRPANSLSNKEIEVLYSKIISVLKEAIKHKGSSVDAYRDLEGKRGGMEERLKVYGRENQPCFICKRPLKKITLGGRGTCFCSYCQR